MSRFGFHVCSNRIKSSSSIDHIWFFLQVRSLAAQFGPALQAHLSLAFQDLQVYSQRRLVSGCEEQSAPLNTEEAPGSSEHRRELFQVLLQSQEEAAPCRYLLQEALVQRCSTLAVMAACQQVTSQKNTKNDAATVMSEMLITH